jgi:hypothetical protein
MPSLPELQRRFAGALLAEAHARDGGIAVYRNTVFANWRNALGATFTVVRQLTGGPFFDAAVDAFAHAHPSTGGDLNVYGGEFPEFLATYPFASDLPYLPDVARLEWAIDEAQRAADAPGTPEDLLAALARIAPDAVATLRFRLDPSCRLLRSDHPVLRIWQVHRTGEFAAQDIAFDGARDLLRIYREDGQVAVERMPPGEFAWLAALADGADLAAALDAALAADATFDLGTVLRRDVANRTVVELR